MIGVRQSRVSATDGNCFEACIASIFECALSDVPPMPASEKRLTEEIDPAWIRYLEEELGPWIMQRFGVVMHTFDIADPDGPMPSELLWIGTTKRGPIGSHHSVVFAGRDCVWDPERGGPGRFTVGDLEQGTVFLALDPARAKR